MTNDNDMTLNLHFNVTYANARVTFPFQTPTKLTLDVMYASDDATRLSMINEYLIEKGHTGEFVTETLSKIESLLADETLELTYM